METEVMYYMQENEVCTKIMITGNQIIFEDYKDKWYLKAFGGAKTASFDDFISFLEERCFPKERANCKEVLKLIGLDYYDPYAIVHKTHGVMCHDNFWIKFEGENITYEETRVLVGLSSN